MATTKSLTRRKAGGTLGAIQRSIGYLQGGYKSNAGVNNVHSEVQLFNTTTQTGSIVYDTGYQRYYTPGLSGNHYGYFSINTNVDFNRFSYISATASASFQMAQYPQVTVSDFGIYSTGWVVCSSTGPGYGPWAATSWSKIPFTTESVVNYGSLSTSPQGTTRQGASSGLCGIFMNTDYTGLTILNFATEALTSNAGDSSLLNSAVQIPCGMSHLDNSAVYFVGLMPFNMKISLVGSTITALSQQTKFTYNFGESHSITTNTSGYMMAGYSDTTGRYDMGQHALCQKITFSNNSITTLPDLVMAQSSGQMMQGF